MSMHWIIQTGEGFELSPLSPSQGQPALDPTMTHTVQTIWWRCVCVCVMLSFLTCASDRPFWHNDSCSLCVFLAVFVLSVGGGSYWQCFSIEISQRITESCSVGTKLEKLFETRKYMVFSSLFRSRMFCSVVPCWTRPYASNTAVSLSCHPQDCLLQHLSSDLDI